MIPRIDGCWSVPPEPAFAPGYQLHRLDRERANYQLGFNGERFVGESMAVTPILTLPGWLVERKAPPARVHVVNPKEIVKVCQPDRELLSENLLSSIVNLSSAMPPRKEKPVGMVMTKLERVGEPETTQSYPVMIYRKLSDVADVHLTIYPTGRVGISFRGKPVKTNAG
jgi:hypothetical protein